MYSKELLILHPKNKYWWKFLYPPIRGSAN